MRNSIGWIAVVVAGIALLVAAVGAIFALVSGHARFIEIAWVSISPRLCSPWRGQLLGGR